jgi:chromosome segregation protein
VLTLDLTRQMQLPLAPRPGDGRGVVGRAADLVRCTATLRPAVEHVLGGVLVVESLDVAQRLMPLGPGLAVVTLDGDIVSGASITGGSVDGETGPLARRAKIAQLAAEAAAGVSACDQAERRCEAARAEHMRAVAAVARAADALSSAQLARRDLDAALERARADVDAREKHHETLSNDVRQARRECERAMADAARYAEASARARASAAALEAQRIAAAQRADALNATLGELRDRHRSAAAEAAALVERVAQAGDDIEAARSAHADCVRAHEARAAALEDSRTQREATRGQAAELTARKSEQEAALAAALAGLEELRGKRDALGASARELEEKLEAAQARERERSIELERTRIRVAEIDAELALLQETFSQNPATDEECASVAGRYATFEGEADAEIRRLRDECARLGNVNLNALEDQNALLERREFLRKQLSDLEAARASILAAIADIDAESLRQFNATFEQIAKAFAETFARLFSGGVGKIWLGEAEDATQAGIEIAAQPPGKKMQSLSLLSGGERAMTAVALIFAILQVRPSPFYIFDEIDAALDEANIGRFGAMLRDISGRAQTIIITHNKATMTLADRIYGVTMGEPGVSNILSLALEQVSA